MTDPDHAHAGKAAQQAGAGDHTGTGTASAQEARLR